MVLPASDDRFSQELKEWFVLHGGPWSGTASELLAALKTSSGNGNEYWPQSSGALYSYIQSHRGLLRSLGVDALLHHGSPRMVSLRSCLDEKNPAGESSSTISAFNRNSGSPDLEGRIFKSIGEALFAIVEMRVRIREESLDLESAIDLVVRRTQEITRSCGVAVGLPQQDGVVYSARTGVAATMGGLPFQANLFQACFRTGRTLQLHNARKPTRLGATCREQGIGSLIIVPIFRDREVAAAIELLFKERRSFSTSDVMDIERIAGVISESLSGIERMELRQAEGREGVAATKALENIESQVGDLLNEKADSVPGPASPSHDNTDAQSSSAKSAMPDVMPLALLATKLARVPTRLKPAFQKAWVRCARVMGIRSPEHL